MRARCIHCKMHWGYLPGRRYRRADMNAPGAQVKEKEPSNVRGCKGSKQKYLKWIIPRVIEGGQSCQKNN